MSRIFDTYGSSVVVKTGALEVFTGPDMVFFAGAGLSLDRVTISDLRIFNNTDSDIDVLVVVVDDVGITLETKTLTVPMRGYVKAFAEEFDLTLNGLVYTVAGEIVTCSVLYNTWNLV